MEKSADLILTELDQKSKEIKEQLAEINDKFIELYHPIIEKFLDEHITLNCNPYLCEENCKKKHEIPLMEIYLYQNTIFVLSDPDFRNNNDLNDFLRGTLIADDVKFLRCRENIDKKVYDGIITEYLTEKRYSFVIKRGLYDVKYIFY